MKRLLFLMLLIWCLFTSMALATDFNGFIVLDQIKNAIEIYDSNPKRVASFKTAPKPARIVKNPGNDGYILMSRGDYEGFRRTNFSGLRI